MLHNYTRTQNVNYTVQRMTKSTNTDNHVTNRKTRNDVNRTRQRNSLLWEFCSNTVLVLRVSHYLQTDAALIMS